MLEATPRPMEEGDPLDAHGPQQRGPTRPPGEGSIASPRHPERADDALIDSILWPAEDPTAAKVFLKIFRGPAGPSPEEALKRIKVPVLGLWGEKDPWTPVDGGFHPGSRFGEHCESWELVTLPGIGHCPHDEAPELCNAEMLKWLKRLDGE